MQILYGNINYTCLCTLLLFIIIVIITYYYSISEFMNVLYEPFVAFCVTINGCIWVHWLLSGGVFKDTTNTFPKLQNIRVCLDSFLWWMLVIPTHLKYNYILHINPWYIEYLESILFYSYILLVELYRGWWSDDEKALMYRQAQSVPNSTSLAACFSIE